MRLSAFWLKSRRVPKTVHISGLLMRLMGRLDGWWGLLAEQLRRRARRAGEEPAPRMQFESFEPRVLMSGDVLPAVAPNPAGTEHAAMQVAAVAALAAPLATDADGTQIGVVFSGPGSASLVAQGAGYALSLSGTDATSRVTLTASGGDGRVMLTGIESAAALASADLSLADLSGGTAHFAAAVASLTLGSLNGASLVFDAAGSVALKLGAAVDSHVAAPNATLALTAASWTQSAAHGASVDAAALGTSNIAGAFTTDLRLSGAGAPAYVLGSLQVAGAVSGLWSVHGRASAIAVGSTLAGWQANIAGSLLQFSTQGDAAGQLSAAAVQVVQIGGSARGFTLLVGADLGDDAALGGSGANADAFRAGTLGRLRVGGDLVDSRILVSLDPVDGVFGDGDDRQLGGAAQRLSELSVGGQILGSSRLVVPALPATASINKVKLDPATLPSVSTTLPDAVAPVVTLALASDSGASGVDRLTRDASLLLSIVEAGAVQAVQLRLGAAGAFQPVAFSRRGDGSVLLGAEVLRALNGGSDLADGAVHVEARAVDAAGNVSQAAGLDFTLDTQAPVASSLGLDPASDTGTVGDLSTEAASVTLVGRTSPNQAVVLTFGAETRTAVCHRLGRLRLHGRTARPRRQRLRLRADRCRRQQLDGQPDRAARRRAGPRYHAADADGRTVQRHRCFGDRWHHARSDDRRHGLRQRRRDQAPRRARPDRRQPDLHRRDQPARRGRCLHAGPRNSPP